MCTHYRLKLRQALQDFADSGLELPRAEEMPEEMPETWEVFPDGMAPVLGLNAEGRLRSALMRWGFPPPVPGPLVTNVRKTASAFWRPWLEPKFRCLVPVSSFAEFSTLPPRGNRWFHLRQAESFCFAGIWRPWQGRRGPAARPVEGRHRLFSFLTTDANSLILPHHPKAMPVILHRADWRTWLTAPADEALSLQVPYPAEAMEMLPLPAVPPAVPPAEPDQLALL